MSTLTIRLSNEDVIVLDHLKKELGEQAGSKALLKAAKIVLDEVSVLKTDLDMALSSVEDQQRYLRKIIDANNAIEEAEKLRQDVIGEVIKMVENDKLIDSKIELYRYQDR